MPAKGNGDGELAEGPVKVVVVGQTPPPHHGQAIMVQALIEGVYPRIQIHHVRMAFSETLEEVGRLRPRKMVELARVVLAIWRARISFGGDVLYFPPAGPNRLPLLRDLAILLAVRPLFRHLVLHLHAGGLAELVASLPAPLRWLSRLAYGEADAAVILSELMRPDAERLGARRQVVVPYGIRDVIGNAPPRAREGVSTILFVGAVRKSKGVEVLVDACRLLAERGVPFRCRIVGGATTSGYDAELGQRVAEAGLEECVELVGEQTGEDKWSAYRAADVFCFPSFYSSEAFPVVLLEAAMWYVPVVATRWRGIPDIVEDGRTGVLVPVHNSAAVADALERLLTDTELRESMGRQARRRFEERHTLEQWRRRMEEVLVRVVREMDRP